MRPPSIQLLLLLPHLSSSSVVFGTVFLMDPSSLQTKAFSALVVKLTNATGLTVRSITPDTITGMEGKRLFGNSSTFYTFQLLHVTRVRASIRVEDEPTASAIIRYSLPHEVALCGLGVMGLDGVEIEADAVWSWFTATYIELPSFVAQYLVLGWGLTVLAFAVCALRSHHAVPRAVVLRAPPASETLQAIPVAAHDPAQVRMYKAGVTPAARS